MAGSTGAWDEDAKTLTWKGDVGPGVSASNTVRFVGDDAIEWRLVATNEQGKRVLDMDGKFTRRK